MNKTDFSLIIPVYRPDRRFVSLMKRVRAQTLMPERIVIVETLSGEGKENLREAIAVFQDDPVKGCAGRGSESPSASETIPGTVSEAKTEGTPETTVTCLQVKREDFDHGGTRDMAARLCGTGFLVFMTMDALPADRQLFRNLLSSFQDDDVACAYARQLPGRNANPEEIFTRKFNYPDQSKKKTKDDLGALGIKTFFCSNVCAAYRRDIYLELGGFEKRTIFNEDMIFAGKAVQAGYAVYYQAQARVIHSHNYTGRMQLGRNFDLGVSQAQHPEVFADIRSDSEGIRLVKETMRYLASSGQTARIPGLIRLSGMKYLGYRLGKTYERLPGHLVKCLSMNKGYWDR